MNKTWLTAIVRRPFVWWACAVVILAAALIGYVFRPVESEPVAEPQVVQAAIDEPGPAPQSAESSEDREYARVVAHYQKIIEQNPNTPQAEKAEQLLREATQRHRRADDRHTQLASNSKPQIKRSRPLRRRTMRRDTMNAAFDEIDSRR